MDITVRQLEMFRAVVIAGSITRAAQNIGLSQPSVSQQLAKLEETLKVQLFVRNRQGLVSLTPAGEYWFKSSEDIVDRMATMLSGHAERFGSAHAVLRLGTTPALRGRFTSAAARITLADPDFVRFELSYAATSGELAEQLRLHRINIALLAESAIVGEESSFAIARLFSDVLVFAVPASVSDDDIRYALSHGADPEQINPVLLRYVDVEGAASTQRASEQWYRSHLPASAAELGAPTFATAVEFVAEGLATTHMLMSLWPNLPQSVRSNVKLFQMESMARSAVLAMRKHHLSHKAFARVFTALAAFCQSEYSQEMQAQEIRPLSDLMP